MIKYIVLNHLIKETCRKNKFFDSWTGMEMNLHNLLEIDASFEEMTWKSGPGLLFFFFGGGGVSKGLLVNGCIFLGVG